MVEPGLGLVGFRDPPLASITRNYTPALNSSISSLSQQIQCPEVVNCVREKFRKIFTLPTTRPSAALNPNVSWTHTQDIATARPSWPWLSARFHRVGAHTTTKVQLGVTCLLSSFALIVLFDGGTPYTKDAVSLGFMMICFRYDA